MHEHAGKHGAMSRRLFLGRAGALAAGAVLGGGSLLPTAAWAVPKHKGSLTAEAGPEMANAWLRQLYGVVKVEGYVPDPPPPGQKVFLPGFTPTSAARLYAYAGIAMYEAVVGGMPRHGSLSTQLNGMPHMPQVRPATSLDWPTALSAAVVGVVEPLFTLEESRKSVRSFHDEAVLARTALGMPEAVRVASLAHGRKVAAALQPWIDRDGFGVIRAKADAYVPPVGPGMWTPTHPNFGPAIEPFWSEVRPFILRRSDEVPAPERPVPYSEVPGSPFWQQAMVPFEADPRRTDAGYSAEQQRDRQGIARFWTDNPIQSGLPSGHWMLINAQFAEQHGLDLARTVEGYARLGVALADAFQSCWTEKYKTNLLRPVQYVRDVVQAGTPEAAKWATFVNTPQFPEYTSGHSVSSLAAAVVLTDLYGSAPFTDRNGDAATISGDLAKARTFTSFMEAAEQAAQSRIIGGIHYPMGVEVGKEQGRRVGGIVVKRLRTRKGGSR
jgi:hypothetical protein